MNERKELDGAGVAVEQCDREAAADFTAMTQLGQMTHATRMRLGSLDNALLVQAFARHRLSATTPPEPEPVDELEAVAVENKHGLLNAAEPYKHWDGDLPDSEDPLYPVYGSGIEYAVRLLAKVLKVEEYEVCDGTEEFDGDLGGTMFNIVLAALPKDEHGDDIHPSQLCEPEVVAFLHKHLNTKSEPVGELDIPAQFLNAVKGYDTDVAGTDGKEALLGLVSYHRHTILAALTAQRGLTPAKEGVGEVLGWLYEKNGKRSLQDKQQPWNVGRGWAETPLVAGGKTEGGA